MNKIDKNIIQSKNTSEEIDKLKILKKDFLINNNIKILKNINTEWVSFNDTPFGS